MLNPTELIDQMIAKTPDWRGATLAKLRRIIHEADPEITEEVRWRGTPVWSHDGIVCLAIASKNKVKLTFYEGASLPDPDKLFNDESEDNQWRAIDLYEGGKINENSLKILVRTAVDYNKAIAKKAGAARGARHKEIGKVTTSQFPYISH